VTTRVRPRLRTLARADAARIAEITRATGVFRAEELEIAAEVFGDAVEALKTDKTVGTVKTDPLSVSSVPPADLPYHVLGAELDGTLVGWICWGATPCTEGTWDLYWLAVDPAAQGHGIGTALVDGMERRLRGKARLISLDTSGRADYTPTRRFYEARGYRAVAVVPDFYAPGDDQVIFTKRMSR
jgi:ribosomal protein S18 acetylase RimI-like enzyme